MIQRRTKPYTTRGIGRAKCARCGKPATESWSVQVCANKGLRRYAALCDRCDIDLNRIVLRFVRLSNWRQLIKNYIERVRPRYRFTNQK